jgi:hypothetical protein
MVSGELKINLLMPVPVGGCAGTGTGAVAVWMSDLGYIDKHQFSIYKIINIYNIYEVDSIW